MLANLLARDTWNRLQKYESFWNCGISGKRSISFRTTIPHPRLPPLFMQDVLLLCIADTKVSLAKRYLESRQPKVVSGYGRRFRLLRLGMQKLK